MLKCKYSVKKIFTSFLNRVKKYWLYIFRILGVFLKGTLSFFMSENVSQGVVSFENRIMSVCKKKTRLLKEDEGSDKFREKTAILFRYNNSYYLNAKVKCERNSVFVY